MRSHALFIFELLTFFVSFLILLVKPTDARGYHGGGGGGGHGGGGRHSQHHTHRKSSGNCYSSTNRNDIRLWNGTAPGAIGKDPCLDVPFLRKFPAKGGVETGRKNPPAILLIPGGGYGRLTNKKEQDPVAEYFASLGVTTFILYYRLVETDGTYRYPVPMQDGQRALKLIRARAKDLGVDGQKNPVEKQFGAASTSSKTVRRLLADGQAFIDSFTTNLSTEASANYRGMDRLDPNFIHALCELPFPMKEPPTPTPPRIRHPHHHQGPHGSTTVERTQFPQATVLREALSTITAGVLVCDPLTTRKRPNTPFPPCSSTRPWTPS
ncbi:hypothetical protein BV898_04166 [Hypsibius exemplaris]|uniref:Uncharacterized protein n=1 Tax=Hypsibius exemplaris TaxID=2072580 RepID=A0A1W0X374_HYPEX|nr:hypothetical protein BV898_04166 [Hypsibius exemplaris]